MVIVSNNVFSFLSKTIQKMIVSTSVYGVHEVILTASFIATISLSHLKLNC